MDKRLASGALAAVDYQLYLNRLPSLYTSAVKKMENSKNRVLLPTDVIHYYIGSYVLQSIEDRLDRRIQVGEPKDPAEKAIFIVELLEKCKKGYDSWSFDWDNFNS